VAIAALVMAGGKATRMRAGTEKPLLQVGGKSMIQRVIEALKESESVNRIIVTVGTNTQQTAETARRLGVEVTETAGDGYEPDMKQAIKSLGLEDVVVVSADLPFLVHRMVDDAVKCYFSSGKPALMVAAPVELYSKFGMKPSYTFDLDDQQVAPVGLNVINGRRIDEPRLDETVFVAKLEGLVFNVNTPTDLELARNRPEGSHDET
jgi:adenosylcobinamide-phosphate guanylyltransferase